MYGKCFVNLPPLSKGAPGASDGKESACNAGDPGSIPGLGRSSGEGNGNPLQYSCLKNSMDRGAWWAIIPWGLNELDVPEHSCTHKNKTFQWVKEFNIKRKYTQISSTI